MIDLKTINLETDKIKEFLSDAQNRMYLILGATFVLAALYLSFIIVPKFNELSMVSRTVRELSNNINLVEGRMKRLDEMTKRLEELREEQASYSKQLPAQKEIPAFLEGLASTAKKSNVRILGVDPGEFIGEEAGEKDKRYYLEMPIVITARSGYHQLGHFINNLEQGERFITIEDLRIQYDNKLPRTHNVKIVLKTYVSVE
ncbi:MAG: type 4a pilus biogenesis protein PilO [Candidatus Omnitrophota bacterium]